MGCGGEFVDAAVTTETGTSRFESGNRYFGCEGRPGRSWFVESSFGTKTVVAGSGLGLAGNETSTETVLEGGKFRRFDHRMFALRYPGFEQLAGPSSRSLHACPWLWRA